MNASTTETLRLFFALWPDDATRAALMQLQASMRGRTIPYDNLHLTLAFLGQQPAAMLPDTKDVLSRLSAPAAMLSLDRVGYFPRNRIAWVGMHQAPDALLMLQQQLSEALAQRGITFDNQKKFKPHITLARDAAQPPDLVFTPIPWRANRVALVQSVTKAEGAVYELVASRSLDEKCWSPDEKGNEEKPAK